MIRSRTCLPIYEREAKRYRLRSEQAFSSQPRKKLYSTSPIERLNKEVKRRADVAGTFPNEASITRLMGAVLFEQNGELRNATCRSRPSPKSAAKKRTPLSVSPHSRLIMT